MKNITKTLLTVSAGFAMAGLLALCVPSRVHAYGQSPSAGVVEKSRVNNAVSAGSPLSKEAKGCKSFVFDDTVATVVLDEGGTTPTTGEIFSVEISSGVGTFGCYLTLFDSFDARPVTEVGNIAQQLLPSFIATPSQMAMIQFAVPKQFHRGLVGLLTGTCKLASVCWSPNGGDK